MDERREEAFSRKLMEGDLKVPDLLKEIEHQGDLVANKAKGDFFLSQLAGSIVEERILRGTVKELKKAIEDEKTKVNAVRISWRQEVKEKENFAKKVVELGRELANVAAERDFLRKNNDATLRFLATNVYDKGSDEEKMVRKATDLLKEEGGK